MYADERNINTGMYNWLKALYNMRILRVLDGDFREA
jgi:hypothetical protein